MTVPEIVMAIGLLLIVLAVGYLVWKSKKSPDVPNALETKAAEMERRVLLAMRKEMANVSTWFEGELSKLHDAAAKHAEAPTPAAEIAATLSPAPVQATPVAGWALGTSYTSPAALLADVARPDFPPVRIDGAQQAGVTGFDFYTLADGSVSQTKPA